MTPKYNTGVIARPARLVNETGNPLCEFAEVLIRIYEQHTAPFGSINTTPSIKELHLPQTEDDTFFLQIEGYPDHRLPVRISGVGLWVQGNPQLRGENGWTDESWHQLADAIPHSSSVVS